LLLGKAIEALPDESRLCRVFYVCRERLAASARWEASPSTMAALDLMQFKSEGLWR